MKHLFSESKRHPSAILFVVQIMGVLLYPIIENSRYGHVLFNLFGIGVLGMTVNMVRKTPGLTWLSAVIAGVVVAFLGWQIVDVRPGLLVWSSALEAIFYFYAAGSLIAYMMADDRTTTDELFAAAATFTLLVWGFTHLFVMIQALQPGAFAEAGAASGMRTWSELNHLSFALLSGTGMGSIVAVSPHARALASLEMMAGVMYLTTVVARLIGFTVHPRS